MFPTPSTPPGVSLIALINATNRLAVITRQPGGNHQPGQFEFDRRARPRDHRHAR